MSFDIINYKECHMDKHYQCVIVFLYLNFTVRQASECLVNQLA